MRSGVLGSCHGAPHCPRALYGFGGWVLVARSGTHLLNQTGVKGGYDFTFQWTPEPDNSAMFKAPEGGKATLNNSQPSDSSGPSIFTAMPEELGLKLESQKGPVPILAVEHIEPSEI